MRERDERGGESTVPPAEVLRLQGMGSLTSECSHIVYMETSVAIKISGVQLQNGF